MIEEQYEQATRHPRQAQALGGYFESEWAGIHIPIKHDRCLV
jgi:hypothetical protein